MEEVDLPQVAEKLPLNLTGADLYSFCADAQLLAVSEQIERLQQHPEEADKVKVIVRTQHFLQAIARLKPSVSLSELKRYQQIRASFENKKTETKKSLAPVPSPRNIKMDMQQ
jgi:peroxin-6